MLSCFPEATLSAGGWTSGSQNSAKGIQQKRISCYSSTLLGRKLCLYKLHGLWWREMA